MCGIVGYVGERDSVPLLVDGLKSLEYRGYDSAGVAIVADGAIRSVRAEGKLRELMRRLEGQPLSGRSGLGHTRWATHGRPSERNAHPIVDSTGRVAVIHNGIIENHADLRARLAASGRPFATDTDTEVVAQLIAAELDGSDRLVEAVRRAVAALAGHYAFAAMSTLWPDEIVAVRNGPPLVLGLAPGEFFLASDPAALIRHTRDVVFLENGDVARLRRDGIEIHDVDGVEVRRPVRALPWDATQVEKGSFPHFMLKEIHEQPQAVQATFARRVRFESGRVELDELAGLEDRLSNLRRVHLVACGTSWHAALVGKFLIEELARLPVDVDYGSEYRYRDPILDAEDLVVGVSQSGETADTLSAAEAAREKGALIAAICNVPGSQLTRVADATLLTHAGPEIGVASTKAFTTQLLALYLLALDLRQRRFGALEPELLRGLEHLPQALTGALAAEPEIARIALRCLRFRNALYLGRGVNYPIALEGALKLKEISYVHAEGYPAGEMKHGPIALVEPDLLTVAVATGGHVFEKMAANLQEVRARDGHVLAVTDQPAEKLEGLADEIVRVPSVGELLQPVVNVVPLQLFAYHAAVLRGADVDQPRNLAKSVTVE
jgi:glucosamine--fructose-6-phosphate aminotransferase (isomerizing)